MARPAVVVAVVVAAAAVAVVPRTLPAATSWAMTRTTVTTVMMLMAPSRTSTALPALRRPPLRSRSVRSRNSISMMKSSPPLPTPQSRFALPPPLPPHRLPW
ncbi:hypothetical protein G6F63_015389 [Rhizopus arrhizus]|nr:hypothetical protein G6F63_015389 [Rhizopus arrhizus]